MVAKVNERNNPVTPLMCKFKNDSCSVSVWVFEATKSMATAKGQKWVCEHSGRSVWLPKNAFENDGSLKSYLNEQMFKANFIVVDTYNDNDSEMPVYEGIHSLEAV